MAIRRRLSLKLKISMSTLLKMKMEIKKINTISEFLIAFLWQPPRMEATLPF